MSDTVSHCHCYGHVLYDAIFDDTINVIISSVASLMYSKYDRHSTTECKLTT